MSKVDGGTAFPGEKSVRFGQTNDCNEGMSLRDYFAAKVIQGECAREDWNISRLVDLANFAYAVADAMIAARETK